MFNNQEKVIKINIYFMNKRIKSYKEFLKFRLNESEETLDTRDPGYGDVNTDEFSRDIIAQYLRD